MVDKPTLLGLEGSNELAFERTLRARAEEVRDAAVRSALEAEARASEVEARSRDEVERMKAHADGCLADAAEWARRAGEVERKLEYAYTLGAAIAITIVGAAFAVHIRWAWVAAR